MLHQPSFRPFSGMVISSIKQVPEFPLTCLRKVGIPRKKVQIQHISAISGLLLKYTCYPFYLCSYPIIVLISASLISVTSMICSKE